MPLRAFFTALSLLCLAGCSGKVAATEEDHTDSCDALANAICTKEFSCSLPSAEYPDVATCASMRKGDCLAGSQHDGNAYTSSALTTCSDAIASAGCFDYPSTLEGSSCAFLYAGRLGVGDACQRGDQCVSGSCSAGPGACGMCQEVGQEGGACADTALCAPNLICTVAGICTRDRARGEMCMTGLDGPRCAFPFACVNGACQNADAVEGTACVPSSSACDASLGLLCWNGGGTSDVGVCTPYTLTAVGQSCSYAIDACAPGSSCIFASDGSTGTATEGFCFHNAAEGEACDQLEPNSGAGSGLCLAPLECIANVCTTPVADACR